MGTFCVYIQEALRKKFNLNVNMYILRKKKHIHFCSEKGLLSFDESDGILAFIYNWWSKCKLLFENYEIVYPHLITSICWKYDHIIFRKKMQTEQLQHHHKVLDNLTENFLNILC